ncbi:MAG: hypothetical protein IPH57_14920 [Saprospiraceae bacterium]|nr:hypothetical protein [Saprospiraceae bacterium]
MKNENYKLVRLLTDEKTCPTFGGCKTKYWISGMPEYWKDGILKQWNVGIMEYWMIGKIKKRKKYPVTLLYCHLPTILPFNPSTLLPSYPFTINNLPLTINHETT